MKAPTSVVSAVAHLAGPGKLKVINERLAYSTPGKSPLRLDSSRLQMLYCYGDVSLSDAALRVLLREGVEVALLSSTGARCRGRLVTAHDSTIRLRQSQFRLRNRPVERLEISRDWIVEKIDSARKATRHFQRHGAAIAGGSTASLEEMRDRAASAESLGALRGLEGRAAVVWFRVLGSLVAPKWNFRSRRRRPPTDPVNSLLSLSYAWLTSRVQAALQARGLEATVGVYHDERPGRPSLACDLMEPLRIVAVDRWVIRGFRRNNWSPDDFETRSNNGVYLARDKFTDVLGSWERHWHRRNFQQRLDDRISTLCGTLYNIKPS